MVVVGMAMENTLQIQMPFQDDQLQGMVVVGEMFWRRSGGGEDDDGGAEGTAGNGVDVVGVVGVGGIVGNGRHGRHEDSSFVRHGEMDVVGDAVVEEKSSTNWCH